MGGGGGGGALADAPKQSRDSGFKRAKVHLSWTENAGRPGAHRQGRSDGANSPRVAPAASHLETDGSEGTLTL